MGSYSVRQDLMRFRKEANGFLEISRSRRKLTLKLGFLSNLATINEILCSLDWSRYCRTNAGSNELTGEQTQLKLKLEAHKRDALFMIGYSQGYGPKQIMFDHQRLLDLNKKQRRVGFLSKVEEAEKGAIQEQIRVLYQNDPETKGRERRNQLITYKRKYSLTTHQERELSLIDKLYPGIDPQYPDYNLPEEGMRVPYVDYSKWLPAPIPRPDLATSYDLDPSAPILLVGAGHGWFRGQFSLLGYTDMDFCNEINEGLHRRRLFNYRLVVTNIHGKSERGEAVLELVNQHKFNFPTLLVNFTNSGWKYNSRDVIEEHEMEDAERLARRLSELGFMRRQTS